MANSGRMSGPHVLPHNEEILHGLVSDVALMLSCSMSASGVSAIRSRGRRKMEMKVGPGC
jgi:hypothetical protein